MKQYGFGIDIGGTTIKLGLFHREGTPPRTLAIAQHRKESETHEP